MLTLISEHEFETHDPLFRIIVHDHPRAFGRIQLPSSTYTVTLCWRSPLVAPVLLLDHRTTTLWVGVDQRVVCVSRYGNTLFALGLFSALLDIVAWNTCTGIVCETQVLVINQDYTPRALCDLREIPNQVDLHDDTLTVTFIDGTSEAFPI